MFLSPLQVAVEAAIYALVERVMAAPHVSRDCALWLYALLARQEKVQKKKKGGGGCLMGCDGFFWFFLSSLS
jgi:hypothetical protein